MTTSPGTTTTGTTPLRVASDEPAGWTGWISFAAAMLFVIGTLSCIAGLAALLRDESYFAADGQLLVFDYTSWGWIHLALGLLLIAVGVGLSTGAAVARIAAVIVVGLNLVAQFTWMSASPWWSAVMITIDILVIYAILVHGGELRRTD